VHYTSEELAEALKEGIPLTTPVEPEQLARIRLVIYDRNSNAVGSLTIPVN
jgi:hypothetical protein